jgi:hypothetical protein
MAEKIFVPPPFMQQLKKVQTSAQRVDYPEPKLKQSTVKT